MDADSATHVIKGTAAVSLLGGLAGATYGAIKRQPPIVLGTATALNSGLSAFVFFGTREYIVKPGWQSLQNQQQASGEPAFEQPPYSTVRSRRTEGVPETIIAGSLTGGILNAWKHGPKAAVSGTLTWAIVTGLIHTGYNQLRLARIQYVSNRLESTAGPSTDPAFSISPQHPPPSRDVSTRIMDIMTWIAPVKKLSDEEYLEIMRRKQAEVDARIRQLDRELSKGHKPRSSDDSRDV
ncbi:hypothetical protein FRC03_012545 [Tulasnella sp. 419]|nr:hypothetical protein FRC03_012545 [Tulasnella sp. 419]